MAKVNLIWDFDGTIIDSYDVIFDRLEKVFFNLNLDIKRSYIKELVIGHSLVYLFDEISKKYKISLDKIHEVYEKIRPHNELIKLLPHVKEVLSKLDTQNYILTHRGIETNDLLKKFNIDKYFIEVVTRENGLKRKPDPEGILYFIKKYNLDKENTYYIGDRSLDIECALNAGVKSIYYDSNNIGKIKADYYINDLSEIIDILEK